MRTLKFTFSSPELRSFWPVPRIESPGRVQKQEVCESNRLQKWVAIALDLYPGPPPELSIRGPGQKDRSSGDENVKFKAQPTNAFFAALNQIYGGFSQLPTTAERCSYRESFYSRQNDLSVEL